MQMTAFLDLMTAFAAFASGACWIAAARVKVVWAAMGTPNGPAPRIMKQVNKQSRWNASAAWFAAAAAIAQGIAAVIRILSY
jgi:hypothetical protein